MARTKRRHALGICCLLLAACIALPVQADSYTLDMPLELHGLTLRWYVHYDGQNEPVRMGTNATSQWIQDVLGVQIEWISSNNQSEQTLAAMLSTGDMPDLITMSRGEQMDALIAQGWLVPLDEYYARYSGFRRWAGPDVTDILRSKLDGKWYAFPSWYTDAEHPLGNAGWIVNRKVYNALGRPSLATLDDLYAFLVRAKAEFPENPPFSPGNLGIVYASFGEGRLPILADQYVYRDGDRLHGVLEDPAWEEMILFMNRLCREGLLAADEYFLSYQQQREKLALGQVVVMPSTDALGGTQEMDIAYRALDPEGGYEVIYPPVQSGVNPESVAPAAYERAGGQTVTVITAGASNPQRVYAFLDWLASDSGSAVVFDGPPGLYWDTLIEFEGAIIPDTDTPAYRNRDEATWRQDVLGVPMQYVANGAWAYIESRYREALSEVAPGAWDNLRYAQITRSTALPIDEYIGLAPLWGTQGYALFQRMVSTSATASYDAIFAPTREACVARLEEGRAALREMDAQSVWDGMTAEWLEGRRRMGIED